MLAFDEVDVGAEVRATTLVVPINAESVAINIQKLDKRNRNGFEWYLHQVMQRHRRDERVTRVRAVQCESTLSAHALPPLASLRRLQSCVSIRSLSPARCLNCAVDDVSH